KKVRSLINKCRHFNVPPIFFSRYYPPREPHPVSDMLGTLVEECVEYLSIMTDGEVDRLVDDLPMGLKMFLERRPVEGSTRKWLERIALYYLAAVCWEEYFSIKQVLTDKLEDSVVLRTYPELSERLDADGLLHIDDSLEFFDGGIEYKGHILHYHQFLRRGFSSNPNFDFLGRFIRYYHVSKGANGFRIAIDHRRIMPKEYYEHVGEFDTWFGPPFDRGRLDDPNAVGLTVVKRVRPSLFDMVNKLDRTEVFWSYRDGVKTFEVEELSSEGASFDSYYLNRYVHSERDINLHRLRHFDGAVKVYLKDSYQQRLATQPPNELKSYRKVKLFRVDGDIDVDEWIELICLFYKHNEMLLEYFNPEHFEQVFGERLRHHRQVMTEREGTL
ncbi:MAG TPA: hypothetical protein VN181_16350, partial [Thermoanaerobaculia bacterium]|nr:hypothetical protein [Thermoanaerobaculia bacterium]